MGHATMENRHGLAVAGMVTLADGSAERRAAERMLKAKAKAAGRRITAGADKAYDTADHVGKLRAFNVTSHVRQNNGVTREQSPSSEFLAPLGLSRVHFDQDDRLDLLPFGSSN